MTYLLTFICYGTHLPGDERGWVERTRGPYRGGFHEPSENLGRYAYGLLESPPYQLDQPRASVVLDAIREVCRFRGWDLFAAHVLTTHVHIVADRLPDPKRALVDFKSYSSRSLSGRGFERPDCKRWARGGNTRHLPTLEAIFATVRYVANDQGPPMAIYVMDRWAFPSSK
ncbi:MAG TPA: hypothetical protein VKG25_19295 [Bryobacteraceae bacterium]|nr:hypothetical protein [Bryobacteraceae bacterium]